LQRTRRISVDKKLFKQLVESIKEAARISRGEKDASRVFVVDEKTGKRTRKK
jgi:hypothetical protein